MAEIDREQWNRLANPGWDDPRLPHRTIGVCASKSPYNPFVSWEFLQALEEAGCACARTGWLPQHLLVKDADGTLRGAAPCYLKSHSQGEYVFDYGWADAFERAGGRYYPKLQLSVPFTPVTGPRLLVADDTGNESRTLLAAGIAALCERHQVSSAHVTFLTEPEWTVLTELEYLGRV